MLFGQETSFPLWYKYDNLINRIRKQFSIEWYGQNKVPYGPKHGLYRKNLCQTLFCHETSFILRYGHQTGTIWIRKPFSIDLNDQNQVPIGPNRGFYRNFEFFEKNHQKITFFFIVRGWFLDPSEGFGTGFGWIRTEKWRTFFFPENHFFRP